MQTTLIREKERERIYLEIGQMKNLVSSLQILVTRRSLCVCLCFRYKYGIFLPPDGITKNNYKEFCLFGLNTLYLYKLKNMGKFSNEFQVHIIWNSLW